MIFLRASCSSDGKIPDDIKRVRQVEVDAEANGLQISAAWITVDIILNIA